MPGLSPLYITGPELSDYFVDAQSGAPLAGGKIYFYKDISRTTAKPVYELVQGSGSPPNYSYAPLPNPLVLSGVGTPVDNNGNQIAIYYYPYDVDGNVDLYYIQVFNANGQLQETREAWPYPNLPNPSTTSSAIAANNQITNPQFSIVFFSSTLTFHFTGSGTNSVNIAPGWTLNYTYNGTGTLQVTQTPVVGQNAYPYNPPFTLDFSPGANLTAVSLTQQFSNNPDWAASQSANNLSYICGTFLLGTGATVSMTYTASSGNVVPQVILNATNNTGVYTQYTNTIQMEVADSSQNGNVGYDTITINLPVSTSSSISNIQVMSLGSNSTVQYEETTSNNNINRMFNYYNSLLQYKPMPSYLVGWDFSSNPAQFLGTSVAAQATGANTSYYAWDQTIVFQTTNSGITISKDASGALKTLSAQNAGTQLALIQYIPAPQAIEMLSRRKCVLVSAKGSASTIATISLWYTKGSLPSTIASNNSIVATLDANGYPATQNGTWVQVPRSGLSNAAVTTGATNAAQFTIGTNATANFNQYSFNGWDMQGNTDINSATFFAIVVGTASLAQNAYILWQSISCQDGDIATVPAPKSTQQVLSECQYYYSTCFNPGVVPATQVGLTSGVYTSQASAQGRMVQCVQYPVPMYAAPTTLTIYNPVNNNGQAYDINVITDGNSTSTNYQGVSPSATSFTITALAATSTSHELAFYYSADSRLGQ